jgi:hypothetical protein
MSWKQLVIAMMLALAPGSVVRSATTADSAVVANLLRSDPQVVAVRVWRRMDVGEGLDLVLAMGTQSRWPFDRQSRPSEDWGPYRPLWLLLQQRSNPSRLYSLGTTVGPADCTAHIARMGATDVVLTCVGEKHDFGPAHKWVFDPRAKRLVSHFTYQPFVSYQVRRLLPHGALIRARSADRTVDFTFTVSPSVSFTIPAVDRDAVNLLQLLPSASTPPLGTPFGSSRSFTLVELDGTATDNCGDNEVVIHERVPGKRRRQYRQPLRQCGRIGPTQMDGDKLWFGRTYYAGEGRDGTGGFGYFDTLTRRFQVWSPPEIRDWSVSAIHTNEAAVWIGLVTRQEWGDWTGGILQFARDGRLQRRYDTPRSIVDQFVTIDDVEYALTDTGIIRLDDSGVHGYMVDQTSDGRLRVAESLP